MQHTAYKNIDVKIREIYWITLVVHYQHKFNAYFCRSMPGSEKSFSIQRFILSWNFTRGQSIGRSRLTSNDDLHTVADEILCCLQSILKKGQMNIFTTFSCNFTCTACTYTVHNMTSWEERPFDYVIPINLIVEERPVKPVELLTNFVSRQFRYYVLIVVLVCGGSADAGGVVVGGNKI